METKKFTRLLCIIIIQLAVTKGLFAQQPVTASSNRMLETRNINSAKHFSAKVFMAPNKTYGYDILMNGKILYHQPAFSRVPDDNDLVITKKEQATTAAQFVIEKIKKGENPALSIDELKKIVAR